MKTSSVLWSSRYYYDAGVLIMKQNQTFSLFISHTSEVVLHFIMYRSVMVWGSKSVQQRLESLNDYNPFLEDCLMVTNLAKLCKSFHLVCMLQRWNDLCGASGLLFLLLAHVSEGITTRMFCPSFFPIMLPFRSLFCNTFLVPLAL